MVKVTKIEITNLNNEFYKFQRQILQSKRQDRTYFVSKMGSFEKQYKKAGLQKNFANIIFSFAEQMQNMGIGDLPGILFSNLIKMSFITSEAKELYAKKALIFARGQGDSIHALARIIDLKILYKQSGQNHKYIQILFEEEKELMKICGNFKAAKNSFRTHARAHSNLKRYEMELATVRVDIAKTLLKNNPKQARALLLKARAVFEKENRKKEVEFVNLMLSEIC